MPKTMAVTHADLEPRRGRNTDLGSKIGAFLIVLTILCGLFCFILCLIAEATRSELTWVGATDQKGKVTNSECVYRGSGKTPLLCAASAFMGLAIVMVVEHTYMLIAVTKSPPSVLLSWDPSSSKSLAFQAGFFFVSTWICFSVGEILLLIGLSVESGHLKNWSRPRTTCLVIRPGLFSAAGVFALTSVFLAAGLYLTALRAQRMSQEQENVRRHVLEVSALYASPPTSPPNHITAIARENPLFIDNQIEHHPSFVFPMAYTYSKDPNLV